ncbi:hypothetical protein PIB30_078634 [Stylosanthes scabra]|uniref:Uncharacterized protein n=1 Tax=Stylosanthes scabra TaxID=79078 RepID=A0ABU6VTI8_9FABA|nr:hypothetical protein [Stylosanthes scabra]
MYWTSRVGYDNRPGELTLAVGNRHASYAFVVREREMGLRVACYDGKEKVQVQAWKVAKHVVSCYGSVPPVGQVIRCVCSGELERVKESSVYNVTISAECVRGAVSHIGVLYLVSEQLFPCEPEEWNCYTSEHNLNQRSMRKLLPKAIL